MLEIKTGFAKYSLNMRERNETVNKMCVAISTNEEL